MYIAVDFDGTIVEHDFPRIGRPIPGATKWLKQIKNEGGKLILWTCRTGKRLQEAIDYCESQGVVFNYVNENPNYNNLSNKVYANLYIDDASIGIPTRRTNGPNNPPTVNWDRIGPVVMRRLLRENPAPSPSVLSRVWSAIRNQPQVPVFD